MRKINEVELTGEQGKKWSETKAALLWKCPAFAHIFYTMLDRGNRKYQAIMTDDPAIPIAGTDGSNLIINPEKFFGFNLYERVFIVAHEILHCIMNHMVMMHRFQQRGNVGYADGTTLDYIHPLMNMAMDYVINDVLVESQVGSMPSVGCHDKKIATSKDATVDVYRKLFQQAPKGKGKTPGNGGGFDTHLPPGTGDGQGADKAAQERAQQDGEWATQIAAAAHSARLQGKLPAGLERLFTEVLNPQVDWRDKIRGLFARRLGSGGYSWRKLDRRLLVRDIGAPARMGYGAGIVVVGGDTSGSIGPKELNMFLAEVAGILEDVRPERLFLIWCDAEVQRVDECEEVGDLNVIRHNGAPGGGGTSFVPVFDWIRDQGFTPDALVYLTDGYGTFPQQAPSYPVIWGSITPEDGVKYPFGDVVVVPRQA